MSIKSLFTPNDFDLYAQNVIIPGVEIGRPDLCVCTYSNSLADSTGTAITLTNPPLANQSAAFNNSNPTRMTIGDSDSVGWYSIVVNGSFPASATGSRYIEVRKNGTTNLFQQQTSALLLNSVAASVNYVTVQRLVLNDYIEFVAFQSSGGAQTITGTVSIYKISN